MAIVQEPTASENGSVVASSMVESWLYKNLPGHTYPGSNLVKAVVEKKVINIKFNLIVLSTTKTNMSVWYSSM